MKKTDYLNKHFDGNIEKANLFLKFFQDKSGKLLDVGCSTGGFLDNVKDRWDVFGVEPDKESVKCLKDKGIPFYNGFFEGFETKDRFDVITLWAVLEHTKNPLEILHKSNKLLKNEGYIVILVPNINSVQAKLFGKYWFHLAIPEHLHHFNLKTLTDILNKSGFKVEKVSYMLKDYNASGWIISLYRFLFSRNKVDASGVFKKGSEVKNKDFYYKLAMFFVMPLCYLMSFLHLGGTLIVFAKKCKK